MDEATHDKIVFFTWGNVLTPKGAE